MAADMKSRGYRIVELLVTGLHVGGEGKGQAGMPRRWAGVTW